MTWQPSQGHTPDANSTMASDTFNKAPSSRVCRSTQTGVFSFLAGVAEDHR